MAQVARTINIGGDPNDANYRYKMQPLQTKIEGRGNGIKTILLNAVEVSKDLRTLPEYLTKFFGVELGALSKFDKTRQVGIVNGAHQTRDMQVTLQRFVDAFILCPQPRCRLPELEMRVKKSTCVVRCASCGHTGALPTGHRLKQYIVNNPPAKDRAPPPRTKTRRQRGPKPQLADAGEERPKRKKAKGDIKGSESWSTSPLEGLAVQRFETMFQIASTRKGVGRKNRREDNDDESGGSQLQNLRTYVNDGHTIDEICFELDRLVRAYDFDPTKKMKLLFDVVFDLDDTAVGQFIPTIREKAELLERFTRSEKEFFLFIGCVEEILTIRQTRLADKMTVSKIFLEFYDCGVFDEGQLMQWYRSPADSSWIVTKEDAQTVRDLVAPFMEWLQTAETEEGAGDDEDDYEDEDENENEGEGELEPIAEHEETPAEPPKPVDESAIAAEIDDL